MLKNITLNASFRKWLRQYVRAEARAGDFDELMQSLAYVQAGLFSERSREQGHGYSSYENGCS